jgi:outer membrane protein
VLIPACSSGFGDKFTVTQFPADSWGLAYELGAGFMPGETWFLNASFRYSDIETDAAVNGNFLGKVEIDPWV